jgi:hypothetical protein
MEVVVRNDAREANNVLTAGRTDVNYNDVVWLRARRSAGAEPREGTTTDVRPMHEKIRADVGIRLMEAAAVCSFEDMGYLEALLMIPKDELLPPTPPPARMTSALSSCSSRSPPSCAAAMASGSHLRRCRGARSLRPHVVGVGRGGTAQGKVAAKRM